MKVKKKLLHTLNICIVGEPNSGKSTLLNKLIKKKVSIVTRKSQTTMFRQRGVLTIKNKQLIFYDTPGIFGKKNFLTRGTFKEASNTISDTDLALLIINLKDLEVSKIKQFISHLNYHNKKYIIIINKIDLHSDDRLLKTINLLSVDFKGIDIFPLSALKNKGIVKLRNYLLDYQGLKKIQKLKPNIKENNHSFIKEIIREKILNNIHDEIPYNLKVEIDKIQIKKDKSIEVRSSIIVKKNTYKPIIIGKKGENIKKISLSARKDLENIFNKKYHLYIHLKVFKKPFKQKLGQ